jgi:hypothetical protein
MTPGDATRLVSSSTMIRGMARSEIRKVYSAAEVGLMYVFGRPNHVLGDSGALTASSLDALRGNEAILVG